MVATTIRFNKSESQTSDALASRRGLLSTTSERNEEARSVPQKQPKRQSFLDALLKALGAWSV